MSCWLIDGRNVVMTACFTYLVSVDASQIDRKNSLLFEQFVGTIPARLHPSSSTLIPMPSLCHIPLNPIF